ncbi:phosphoribosyl-AMP cyclohydrolase [Candidatus Thorarchaeota archaeon]|nr:MAG: phosphoribosyl-AMP cyclohydrolase [Candidatus Thorarchaeota archaeon]
MKQISLKDLDFDKGSGLIPIVVQDMNTKEVLTLAYANKEALELTLGTGLAHFYRRSHDKVMMKGETSGNIQKVSKILSDCDVDAIIYIVEPSGPACHEGTYSCFHCILYSSEQ